VSKEKKSLKTQVDGKGEGSVFPSDARTNLPKKDLCGGRPESGKKEMITL